MSSPALPPWLVQRLREHGGRVDFATYMAWVLHDADHGAYGSGHLQIGPAGDFTTSTSLGPCFIDGLLPQILQALDCLAVAHSGPLSVVEWGPGEGHGAAQLAAALLEARPSLRERLELVLVEPNPGLARRQAERLAAARLPWRHASTETLQRAPVVGLHLANEVLDALPVRRLCRRDAVLRWLDVALCGCGNDLSLAWAEGKPLTTAELDALRSLGSDPLSPAYGEGWTTEWNAAAGDWLTNAAGCLVSGWLWLIDYALEARRYFSPRRASGTLMTYYRQQAGSDPFARPGQSDLTAHLCLELIIRQARAAGYEPLGQVRQGEGLLALGLAGRLAALSAPDGPDLAERLRRREAMLRLVDPAGLGDFRWILLGLRAPAMEPAMFAAPQP
ncbi:MAG: SAM-dependent methyltransferase [Aphanocapsa feldmannii 277cV]|uniref:SAM-dependent methyltransferase n=2 Tax=Aphanocapsa feldmannii TaxID=192050 RepID=A0A524RPM1_9CHRO|nr:MAG: SAM-dependent methyltransferase [Aphanocapsa feldmannii 277cV]TGH20095.1 MAG: SAM-dependent methyltransferase [Aphanocapsa feldmannii 277cI]